jgi:replicative DNA helicase Mcm
MALKTKATIEDAEEAIRLVLSTLSKVGFDVESGKLDIDVLETGISASRRAKKKKFREFLFKYLEEVGGETEINNIVSKAAEEGFEKDFVLEEINELRKSGELYMPKPGKIAKVK